MTGIQITYRVTLVSIFQYVRLLLEILMLVVQGGEIVILPIKLARKLAISHHQQDLNKLLKKICMV